MKGMRKMISLWLALCLVVSMVPVPTFAEETAAETAVTETTVAAAETTLPTEAAEETTATEEPTVPETKTLTVTDEALGAEVTASGTCGENLTWTLDENGLLTISGSGAMYDYSTISSKPPSWSDYCDSIKTLMIAPGVTSIGNEAFDDCSSLIEATISDSVTSIGKYAFASCSSLNNIVIPDSVTSIGNYAFHGCSGLTSISIPDNAAIGQEVFGNCSNLRNVILPESLTSIPANLFYGCSNLNGVVIPSSVTSVNDYAFYDCEKLAVIYYIGTKEEWNALVPEIGICNEPLKRVAVKNYEWDGAVFLDIQDAGEYWCLETNGTLHLADYYSKINHSLTYPEWYQYRTQIKKAVIDCGTSYSSEGLFPNHSNLTEIVLKGDIATISYDVFKDFTILKVIYLPKSLTAINSNAFSGCTALSDVYYEGTRTEWDALVPNIASGNEPLLNAQIHCSDGAEDTEMITGTCGENLTWKLSETGTLTISGSGSMTDWGSLYDVPWYDQRDDVKSVVLENGVTHIGNNAFYYCRSLTGVSIPDTMISIGDYGFSCCSSLTSISIPDTVSSIGKYAFYYCSTLDNVILPSKVTEICDAVFSGCSSLTQITLPENIISIGFAAFSGCSGLCEIIIPSQVNKIDSRAFEDCVSLNRIEIPENVTWLMYQTFLDCSSMTEIILPRTLTQIDSSVFKGCTALTDVYYGGTQEEWNALLPNIATGNDPLKSALLHTEGQNIPANTCGENLTWKLGSDGTLTISGTGEMTNWTGAASVPWNAVASSITGVVVESGVTSIGTYAFSGCTALADVTLPDTLAKIGHSAFAGCSQLTGIVIPNGVTSIEKSTFSDCSALVDVTIPSGVSSIGASAFYHCENLTDILIPDGVTEIDSFAFDHCTNLKTVLLPNTLKTIGSYAFRDCVSLANFRIPEGTKTLNNGAFLGCKALKSIIIPETVTSLGDNVFTQCSGLTSVVISAKVKELPLGLFEDCEDLTTITLPVTLTSVKDNAFNGCNDLKCVYYGGTKQQWDAFVPSKVGTGNEPLLDPDLQLRCQEYSPEIALLEEYAEDWYVKYEEYMRAVITVLNELPEDIEESRSEQIRKSAERMKNHDKKSDDKYIVFTYSISNMAFCPEEYKDACYLALAEALYDNLAEHIDFSKIDFSEYTDGGITNIVAKNIVNVNQEYSYDGITVMIKIVGFGQTMNGSLYCTVNSMGKAPYEAMLKCPQEMYLEEMENLCKELSELGVASVDYGYAAFAEDILAGALHEMNEAKLQEKLGSTANGILKDAEEEFISYGTGKFIDAVKSCNRYFTFLVKPIQDGNSANLIRETNLYGVAGIDFESFYDLGEYELEGLQVDSRVRKALNKLEKASEKLEKATEEYLNGELSASSKFSWKSFFNCPVSVSIFDSAGTQIGYVGEDDIWYHDNIIIEETAGAKIISSLTDEIPSFRIAATDYGTMSCSFEEYDEAGLPVGRLNFYDIPLAPNQNFQVELQEDLENNQNGIQVKTAGTDHNCSEYIPATEDAAVTILGTAVADDGTAGGTVNGGGICTRGDAAILLAVPEIGYSFNGWYQENILISLNAVYEFTAKEDVVLTAKFRKNDELQVCVVAETGGCVFGNGRFSRGDTAEVLAVAQSGYQFTGWYQDGVIVSDKDNYSFNVTENVTLTAKFEKTANLTKTVPMHRMYDPNSGEHFYSGSELERDFLVEAGWHYEGVGFNFPEEGAPVHRLYDPVHGEHLYTMDEAEMNELLDQGWNYEGVAFNSAGNDEVPQYRLHNPNAKRGGYHFTGSEVERDLLISYGWILQGIGWYSCLE